MVRIVGAVYLVSLGVQVIRHRNDEQRDVPVASRETRGRRAYWNGVLTNLLNPKMVTFTIAFIPQLINPQLGDVWMQFVILGASLIVFEFLVDGTVGVVASQT